MTLKEIDDVASEKFEKLSESNDLTEQDIIDYNDFVEMRLIEAGYTIEEYHDFLQEKYEDAIY